MGNWFPRKHRGFLVGLWATGPNVGNIIGIQLSSLLLRGLDYEWWWLMIVVAVIFLVCAFLLFFFLVPEPEDIGLEVQELDQKERIYSENLQ